MTLFTFSSANKDKASQIIKQVKNLQKKNHFLVTGLKFSTVFPYSSVEKGDMIQYVYIMSRSLKL